MDDFPVPACPKRMRPRSEVGLFTRLIMKSRNATRVPIRHPLSGLNREFNPYGISLTYESSSMTIIRSATQKPLTITYRHLKFESIFLPLSRLFVVTHHEQKKVKRTISLNPPPEKSAATSGTWVVPPATVMLHAFASRKKGRL